MKIPEHFEYSFLHANDFDGTMYDTFEVDPEKKIYGVDEAYYLAVSDTFSHYPDAIQLYKEQDGHQHRTPVEIVDAIVPEASPEEIEKFTQELVKSKLEILESQIGSPLRDGTPWPRPVPGFIEYSAAVENARQQGVEVVQAVISAGHASFIRKCLTLSGVQEPDILVTNETITGLNSTLPPERLAKPSIFPLKLAVMQWRLLYGVTETLEDVPQSLAWRITVTGDSQDKDGGLAENAGSRFVKITKGSEAEAWRTVLSSHQLGVKATTRSGLEIR